MASNASVAAFLASIMLGVAGGVVRGTNCSLASPVLPLCFVPFFACALEIVGFTLFIAAAFAAAFAAAVYDFAAFIAFVIVPFGGINAREGLRTKGPRPACATDGFRKKTIRKAPAHTHW